MELFLVITFFLIASSHRVKSHLVSQRTFEYSVEAVDLSYVFDEETVYWPTFISNNLTFKLEAVADGWQEGGFYYRSKWFKTAEHGGTHLDAPSHFAENGWDFRIRLLYFSSFSTKCWLNDMPYFIKTDSLFCSSICFHAFVNNFWNGLIKSIFSGINFVCLFFVLTTSYSISVS